MTEDREIRAIAMKLAILYQKGSSLSIASVKSDAKVIEAYIRSGL